MAAHPNPRVPAASAATLLFLLAASAAAAPPGVEVAVRSLGDGALAAPVRIAGATAWMLVDTGATRSRIRADLAARLELRPTARHALQTLDGVERLAQCHGPIVLELAGLALQVDCLSWSADLTIPLGLDGVLGADALAGADFLLDAAAERLRVAPAGELLAFVEGEVLPVQLLEGRPAVVVRWRSAAASRSGELVLDSGADGPILFGELARALTASPRASRRLSMTAGASVETWTIRLSALEIGERALPRPLTVLLPGLEDRREAGLLPPGHLGSTLFALRDGVVVAGARLRRTPRSAPFAVAERNAAALWLAP